MHNQAAGDIVSAAMSVIRTDCDCRYCGATNKFFSFRIFRKEKKICLAKFAFFYVLVMIKEGVPLGDSGDRIINNFGPLNVTHNIQNRSVPPPPDRVYPPCLPPYSSAGLHHPALLFPTLLCLPCYVLPPCVLSCLSLYPFHCSPACP
jgi:hypothetical protein